MIRPLTNKKQKISKEMALAIRHLFRLALSSSASQLSGAFVLLPTRYASRCLCSATRCASELIHFYIISSQILFLWICGTEISSRAGDAEEECCLGRGHGVLPYLDCGKRVEQGKRAKSPI